MKRVLSFLLALVMLTSAFLPGLPVMAEAASETGYAAAIKQMVSAFGQVGQRVEYNILQDGIIKGSHYAMLMGWDDTYIYVFEANGGVNSISQRNQIRINAKYSYTHLADNYYEIKLVENPSLDNYSANQIISYFNEIYEQLLKYKEYKTGSKSAPPYLTTTGNSCQCSGSACSKCNMTNVMPELEAVANKGILSLGKAKGKSYTCYSCYALCWFSANYIFGNDQTTTIKSVNKDNYQSSAPVLSPSISVADYLTHYATVTPMPTTAVLKSASSIQAWKLPWTDDDNASLKLKTVSGTLTIKNKVVNHAGNTWYEIDTGSSTRGFVYGPSITLLPYYTGVDETSVGADNAAVVGTCNNPGGLTLKTGGFYLSTKPNAATYGTKKTDNIPSSYQTAATIPCSYNFKNEYGLTLTPGTTYYYVLYVADSSGKPYYSGEYSFTTTSTKVTGVSISPAGATVNLDGTQQLTATVTPSNATNKTVTWKSSNTAVATVSSSGLVTAIGLGSATVTATAADGSGKAASVTITVTCNHSAGTNTVAAVAPTCTTSGLTEGKTCKACGATVTAQTTVAATGHSYGNWTQTKAPTCTATGTERRDCNNCDHYETRTVAATGHSYTAKVTAPTCTADGYTTYTCSCGDSYTDNQTPATGHSYTSVVTEPTCTAGGYTTYTCSCGDSYTDDETAATGHSYGAWTQTKAPTATEEGEERRDCANCDHYETRAVAATGEVTIVTQPESVEVKSGETAAVTVEAVGEGLTYTWYYKNPGSTSFSKTTAFTGPTYSVTMTEARSGRQVYCLVKDQYGNKVQSDVVTLTMYKTPLKIVTQPESIEVKSGETALVEFEAQGDGLTYTWYYKNSGSSSFSKTTTFTGPSYSVTMSAARDGRQVYCLVTDQYGSKIKTDVVTLSVHKTPLAIVTQPESIEVKSGETALVEFEAQGDGLTYTWYYKNPGASSFTKTTTFAGPSYSVAMTASRSGRQVYCLVKDEYGNKVKTDVVTLTMYTTPLAIVTQSGDMTVAEGETAVVTVEATGDDLTYEWYYKNAGASSYKKTSTFTGNYYTLEMNASRSGRRVYCKITDAYGNTIKTKSVLLTMKTTPLEIVTQPEGFTIAEGETGEIYVEATGDGLKYEWYYKNATASKFTKTSTFTGPEYSLTMTDARSGRHVYCKITDAYGKSVTTDIVTLNKECEIELFGQPEDVTAENGETVEITVFADGNNLKYAWYYRNAGKSEFTKTSTFKGDSYSLEMNSTRNGREVYCVITDSYGNTVASDVVTFRMSNN